MSTEEEIKAAIVVFPEAIGYASLEFIHTSDLAGWTLHQFVNYVQTLDPRLERHEAILVAAAILDGIPSLIETDSRLIAGIKAQCRLLRSKR